jgi:hypothetical protein
MISLLIYLIRHHISATSLVILRFQEAVKDVQIGLQDISNIRELTANKHIRDPSKTLLNRYAGMLTKDFKDVEPAETHNTNAVWGTTTEIIVDTKLKYFEGLKRSILYCCSTYG